MRPASDVRCIADPSDASIDDPSTRVPACEREFDDDDDRKTL